MLTAIKKTQKQRGAVATLLALLILLVVILIVLGLTNIYVSELKSTAFTNQSGRSFYAAEACTEFALYRITKMSGQETGSENVNLNASGATCSADWDADTSIPGPTDNTIYAKGEYGQTARKLCVGWGTVNNCPTY